MVVVWYGGSRYSRSMVVWYGMVAMVWYGSLASQSFTLVFRLEITYKIYRELLSERTLYGSLREYILAKQFNGKYKIFYVNLSMWEFKSKLREWLTPAVQCMYM